MKRLDRLQSWICSTTHPHVLCWRPLGEPAEGTAPVTRLYVTCTQEGCRRESPGVVVGEAPLPTRGIMPPFWWRQYRTKRYVVQAGTTLLPFRRRTG
jgi:hypothetical protein